MEAFSGAGQSSEIPPEVKQFWIRYEIQVRGAQRRVTLHLCRRFEQYLCSVCEFERGVLSMGHNF